LSFLQYWKFNKYPFADDTDPEFYYESEFHSEAVERMKYVVDSPNINMCLLTGEIGSGKTTTRNKLLEYYEYDDKIHYCASLDTADFNFIDILQEIVSQITESSELPRNKYKLTNILKEFIKDRIRYEDFDVLIFIDEIQKIVPKALDALKDLTNIRFEYYAPIKIFLIGQPEFITVVKNLPQINQRIGMRYHLQHLSFEEVRNYIDYRLSCVSKTKNIFSLDAVKVIYSKTGGIPREINRACTIALEFAYAESIDFITELEMKIIFDDIEKGHS
jgi:general secretion pathway protein A